jgi:hypothetical protein
MLRDFTNWLCRERVRDPSTITRPARRFTWAHLGVEALEDRRLLASSPTTTLIPVNAPPVLTIPAGSITYVENAAPAVLASTGTITDADSANFASGKLRVDFSAGGTSADRLAIHNQGTGAGLIGVSAANVTYGGVIIGTFAGGTGTTPLVITFNANATPARATALLRNFTFANVSDNPATTPRTVRFVVSDGDGGTSGLVTKSVAVIAVNDPPVVALGGTGSATYQVGGSAVLLAGLGTVSDVDSANFAGGRLTVTSSSGADPFDRLTIRNQGISAGLIGISSSNVTYGGVIIGTFAGGAGTTPLVITLNTKATSTTVTALLRNVTFANVGTIPTMATRMLRFVLSDGDGGTSKTAIETVIMKKEATATAVTLSQTTLLYGHSVTSTAVVSSMGSLAPTGTVSFYDGDPKNGGQFLATATLGTSGGHSSSTASFSYRFSPGKHVIYAVYAGSADFGASSTAAGAVLMVG